MVFSTKRRFIAGASCPQCKKPDVITVFRENGSDWQACVACGHQESLIHQEDKPHQAGGDIPIRDVDSPSK